MSAVRLPDDIGGEGSDGVDGDVVGRQRRETGHRSQLLLEDDGEGGWEMDGTVGPGWVTHSSAYMISGSPRRFSLDRRR